MNARRSLHHEGAVQLTTIKQDNWKMNETEDKIVNAINPPNNKQNSVNWNGGLQQLKIYGISMIFISFWNDGWNKVYAWQIQVNVEKRLEYYGPVIFVKRRARIANILNMMYSFMTEFVMSKYAHIDTNTIERNS